MTPDARAKQRLMALFPELGPWTSAALWHGSGSMAPVPRTALADELDLLLAQRLSALLLRYVRASGAELSTVHSSTLRRDAFSWALRAANAATSGAVALAALEARGVLGVVSKGPGIARCYPALECRPYSDIDIIVAPKNFAIGVEVLEGAGWSEEARNTQPWPYFRRFCREGLNLDLGDGSVDLHHRFPPWIWSSGLHLTELLPRAEGVHVAGHRLPCLSAADNLMVAALHVVSDRNEPGRSLLVWRDLVELAHQVSVSDATRTARAAGLSGWLRSVLLALPVAVRPAQLVAALPDEPVAHARRLTLLLSPRAEDLGILATQFLRLPLPNGLAFVGGMTVPSAGFLRQKFPDSPHHYRRWWSDGRANAL